MKVVKNYDLKHHNIITLGGLRFGGFGEDGGVEYEYDSDVFEYVSGADGQVTVSDQNNEIMIATITLMETSKSISEMERLRDLQRKAARRGPIPPLPFIHIDIVQGDKIADTYAVFLDRPTPSKARSAGERQYRILLPYAAEAMEQGLLNIL